MNALHRGRDLGAAGQAGANGSGSPNGGTPPAGNEARPQRSAAPARGPRQSLEQQVIADFGREWQRFDQRPLPPAEEQAAFEGYFHIFPWRQLPDGAVGLDLGCGSGRWARQVAPRVGHLHCVDPSSAVEVARANLAGHANCSFHCADALHIPLPPDSLDFAFSLGVLHHVADTGAALRALNEKLKPGAPLLLYLYYALENQPVWYRWLWRASDSARRVLSSSPSAVRYITCDAIALLIYWPLARAAAVLEKLRVPVKSFPLAFYRRRSFYVMRNDALDRFGTRLEKRFTKTQIAELLTTSGFEDVEFSPLPPFWCALAFKPASSAPNPALARTAQSPLPA